MSRTLILDAGNSRLKWGVHDAGGWLEYGAVPNSEIGSLALRDWQNLQRPARVVGVNVAGESGRMRIEPQLTRWRVTPTWLAATAEANGVTNGYANPSQLGADRWAALVAARRRASADTSAPGPVVVVNAGTAVTIDALDAGGVFRGGVILPGLRLMLQSLAEKSGALRVPAGKFDDFPVNTGDAMYSGAVQAISGAIEQIRARLKRDGAMVPCLLTGGAAGEVASHVGAPVEVVDHLVLEGVLALAEGT